MSFWNLDNPSKPKGVKDPDSVLDYPIDISAWLDDISDTYVSHEVLVDGGLIYNESISVYNNGVITVWLSGGTAGETATFTLRITTLGGRIDDNTLYLKIQDK